MTRRRRVLAELLGPPLVATGLVVVIAFAGAPDALLDPMAAGGILVVLLGAYVFASIPSVLFTIIMEVAFARGLDPASWVSVLLAAFLGLVAGMAVVGFNPRYGAFQGMAMLGLATGTCVGAFVRSRTLRNRSGTTVTVSPRP